MNNLPENSASGVATELETLDYLRGVESSTCLLLPATPSPTPMEMDFKHPLAEDAVDTPFLTLNNEPNNMGMDMMQSLDPLGTGDTSSSADSTSEHVVQDPVSAQLINNISMLDYQTLTKNGDLIMGEAEDCKINGNITSNKKLPSFVTWNWHVIRKVLLWVVLSGLIACLGTIIAMVVAIPKTCNPDLPWHQGKVFYEIFPASFKDSNNDGMGDLQGIIKKLDYIHGLGASAIRLNFIYKSKHYPEKYNAINEITNLKKIDESIGSQENFVNLVTAVHQRNMSIILDIPVISLTSTVMSANHTQSILIANDSVVSSLDPISEALLYWSRTQHVDGFYLKRLEDFVDEPNFSKTLQIWKHIIGSSKILIASEKAYEKAKDDALNVLLSRVDLIDIHLDLQNGVTGLKNRIEKVISGTLWSKPHYPWVHWNIGNVDSERLSSRHLNNTLVLTALEFVLPGTISIFYGDEVGLENLPKQDFEKDYSDHKHIHNVVPMNFVTNYNNKHVIPWNGHFDFEPKYHFLGVIRSLTEFRLNTPTIYLRAIYKEGHILKNMEIRKTEENLVVIERWYPRRNTCVFVGNLGSTSITTDLTSMFYGGAVVAGTNTSLIGQVLYFDQVTFPPNSAIILKLEKVVLSGLIACLGTIIAMVVAIPKTCNPDLPWHQGKVFYEIFPASFKDSNNDGMGDLQGIIKKLDYIHGLGASAIRLNFIYKSKHYPEKYNAINEITNLKKIDESIGSQENFVNLVTAVHQRNMSIILDIPVISLTSTVMSANHTQSILIANDSVVSSLDPISEALLYWSRTQHVDGFYLKRLEDFKNLYSVDFSNSIIL